MKSRITLLGHPVHPMLVGYPIALYTATLVGLVLYAIIGNPFWFRAATATAVGGAGMAILAALPGLVDWLLVIPGRSQAFRDAFVHLSLNVAALACMVVVAILGALGWGASQPQWIVPLVLSVVALLLTAGAGFYGFTLVQDHHVGLDMQAQPREDAEQAAQRRPETAG
jgi:uncharacterized membrane protein